MSETEVRHPLRLARDHALAFLDAIGPACEYICIAGSIRRKCETVGDIEIVCVPLYMADLLGKPSDSILEAYLDALIARGKVTPVRCNGPKYKQILYTPLTDIKIDLFITTPDCLPVILAIRTGPADFSRLLVTQRNKGGYLPSSWRVKGGYVIDRDGIPYKWRDEAHFLQETVGKWIEPEDRK